MTLPYFGNRATAVRYAENMNIKIKPSDDLVSVSRLCEHLQLSYSEIEGLICRLRLRTFRLNFVPYIDGNGIRKIGAELEKREPSPRQPAIHRDGERGVPMTGRIVFTTGTGALVQADSGDRFHFRWADCHGFGPSDVGFGSRVRFKKSRLPWNHRREK